MGTRVTFRHVGEDVETLDGDNPGNLEDLDSPDDLEEFLEGLLDILKDLNGLVEIRLGDLQKCGRISVERVATTKMVSAATALPEAIPFVASDATGMQL